MPGISLSDIEQLPDPQMEEDALKFLLLFDDHRQLDRDLLTRFVLGNRWPKRRTKSVALYVVERGWAIEEGGILQITDAGRDKAGK